MTLRMFCNKIIEYQLFPANPDDNVLSAFPYTVQKQLIYQVSDSLSQDVILDLESWGHLKWTMQIVGHAFRMPMDDISLKTSCLSIYFKWLLGEIYDLPKAVREFRETDMHDKLLIKIFQHLSMAFEPRDLTNSDSTATGISETQKKQFASLNINLCFDIVKGLFLVIRKHERFILEDTWVSLLKILFGIVDTVLGNCLKEEGIPEYTQMVDRLAEPLMKLLVETLQRAKCRDQFLWKLIIKRFPLWANHKSVANVWKCTIKTLNTVISKHLYNMQSSLVNLNISTDEKEIFVELQIDFVKFFWYRFLHLIGNPGNYSASNFDIILEGLSDTAEALMGTQEIENQTEDIHISRNTILSMLGPWLNESARKNEKGYEMGKSAALGIFSRIILNAGFKERINPQYRNQYFSAVIENLKGTDFNLAGVFLHCQKLLSSELEGNRFLIGPILEGLHRSLNWIGSPNEHLKSARLSGIKLIFPLIAISQVYINSNLRFDIPAIYKREDNISMIITDIYGQIGGMKNSEMQRCCFYLIIMSITKEKSHEHLKLLFLAASAFLAETFADNLIFVNIILKLQTEVIISDNLSNNVLIDCLDLTERCIEYYLHRESIECKEWECVHSLVSAICLLIEKKLNVPDVKENALLVSKAYGSLRKWCLAGNWISKASEIFNLVISTLSRGMAISEKDNSLVAVKMRAGKFINPERLFMIPRTVSHVDLQSKETKKSEEKLSKEIKHGGSSKVSSFAVLTAEIQIKVSAELAFSSALNKPSHFSSQYGFFHGCYLNEEEIISEIVLLRRDLCKKDRSTEITNDEKQKFVHYYGYQNRIIMTLIELPLWALERGIPTQLHKVQQFDLSNRDGYILLILRDMLGKFSWIFKFNQNKLQSLKSDGEVKDEVDKSYLSRTIFRSDPYKPENSSVDHIDPYIDSSIPNVKTLLDPSSKEYARFIAIRQKVSDLSKYDQEFLESKIQKGELKGFDQAKKPTLVELDDFKNPSHIFNLFLAHFGYLDGSRLQDLIPFPINPNSSEHLKKEFKRIDQLKERESCSATVLYCDDETDNLNKIYSAVKLSPDFKAFVGSLGWIMKDDIDASRGHKFENSQNIHWATATEEISFYVPYANNIPKSNPIIIIWYQSSSNSYESLLNQIFKDENVLICIFIIPLRDLSGLHRIRIEVKKNISIGKFLQNSCPLIHDSLVTMRSMSSLIRMTCISIGIHLRALTNSKKPAATRRHAIESLCLSYKAKDSNDMESYFDHLYKNM